MRHLKKSRDYRGGSYKVLVSMHEILNKANREVRGCGPNVFNMETIKAALEAAVEEGHR